MKSTRNLIIIIVILLISIISIIGVFLSNNSSNMLDFDNNSNGLSDITEETNGQVLDEKPPSVVIDAGHGGWEPGAGNGPINEKDVVLGISLEVEKVLIENSIDYYMIRNDDTYVSLEDRAKIANEKEASLFISIHNNSFSDPSQSGVLTAYNPYSAVGKEIAQIMQSKISDIGMRNRDISSRPNLYVLRHTEMPSLLLEIGFISSNKDLKLITDSGFQKKCAQQIVSGIEEILAKHVSETTTD